MRSLASFRGAKTISGWWGMSDSTRQLLSFGREADDLSIFVSSYGEKTHLRKPPHVIMDSLFAGVQFPSQVPK